MGPVPPLPGPAGVVGALLLLLQGLAAVVGALLLLLPGPAAVVGTLLLLLAQQGARHVVGS